VVIGEGGAGELSALVLPTEFNARKCLLFSNFSGRLAAILWKDRVHAPKAAEALKMSAKDLLGENGSNKIIPSLWEAHHIPKELPKICEKAL